ncbi:formyltransferase family protein [Dactylosporangium sp. CA-139114]|uniref:formyltransferase family protein n=1 Tax=Dactylosporangium sp. CA-139114 TaxID=3239931 RepID=UPI003D97348C
MNDYGYGLHSGRTAPCTGSCDAADCPAPALAAIRAGDPSIGLTVHRMDEGLDTGPVLVQRDGIVLGEWVTPALLWSRMGPVLAEALTESLDVG